MAASAQSAAPAAQASGPGFLARHWAAATDLNAWHGEGHWRLVVSPYTYHYSRSAEHRKVWALAVERQRPDHWLAGASFFSNSFGQPSTYIYLGKQFQTLLGHEQWFGQLSAGLMYGYKGKFEDKVPLNVNGFSPGALVSAGWRFTKDTAVTAHLLGSAGVMLQFSVDLR